MGCTLSIDFWDKCWRLHASIKNNNRFKWLQCQILRNSVYTNNRVAKFKSNVEDNCDLCGQHSERAFTLFFTCNVSQQFWAEIFNYFLGFNIVIPLSRLRILFGVLDEPFDSTINTVVMLGKQVIWTCKYKKTKPTLLFLKRSLKDYLIVLRYCHSIRNENEIFNDQWGEVLPVLIQNDHQHQQQPVLYDRGDDVPPHGQQPDLHNQNGDVPLHGQPRQ